LRPRFYRRQLLPGAWAQLRCSADMSQTPARPKRRLLDITLLLGSVSLCLGAGEVAARLIGRNVFQGPGRMFWIRNFQPSFTLDLSLGYRPVLGSGAYSEYGTWSTGYPIEKRPGVTRVLFIGDSVTAHGKIIDALKTLYGEERFEYWNAGVEGFNTLQEVGFYRDYNRRIHPDLAVLTFHNNDFQTIPVAFLDRHGKLVVYAPRTPSTHATRWLVAHSGLYRLMLGSMLYLDRRLDPAIVTQTRDALAELKALLDSDRIPLRVLLLPVLAPYRTWTRAEKESRAQALRIFAELGLSYVDLLDDLEMLIAAGVNIQEIPDDRWHPSAEAAAAFARRASVDNLLQDDRRGNESVK
jgi:lysophospholipase L1-like esterase